MGHFTHVAVRFWDFAAHKIDHLRAFNILIVYDID